jgi:hypothetical protein
MVGGEEMGKEDRETRGGERDRGGERERIKFRRGVVQAMASIALRIHPGLGGD